jgi:hypothetical protein
MQLWYWLITLGFISLFSFLMGPTLTSIASALMGTAAARADDDSPRSSQGTELEAVLFAITPYYAYM